MACGRLRTTPSCAVDVVPTLLELAGLAQDAPPTDDGTAFGPALPARSPRPACAADRRTERDALWWSHDGHRALRVGDWKLVATARDPWELDDLAIGRTETRDLAAEHPERVRARAQAWQERGVSFRERLAR